MSKKEFNVKSSTIEKGLELAKEFIGKIIGPSLDEVGLLMSDQIKFWRFKNQVNILLKAKNYIEKKNISMKEIPIKILVPLLEQASLEETEDLQEKWSHMLVNMVNSQKNYQSQVFPYLLSQISIEEYNELKTLNGKEITHLRICQEFAQLVDNKKWKEIEENCNMDKIEEIDKNGFEFEKLQGFEIANLVRLGLIRLVPPPVKVPKFQQPTLENVSSLYINAEYDACNGYRITQLGLKFIEVCELNEDT